MFVRDTDDQDPLIRAFAIRTMSCICVEKIIDYLAGPLQKRVYPTKTPCVRKTAAIRVAKLYDLTPELVQENGLLEQLPELIPDSNTMVRFVFDRIRVRRLIHLEGCRDYHLCPVRYSHSGDVAAVHILVRPSCLHPYPDNPEQTPYRARRMLRMGPRRLYTVCFGTVPGIG